MGVSNSNKVAAGVSTFPASNEDTWGMHWARGIGRQTGSSMVRGYLLSRREELHVYQSESAFRDTIVLFRPTALQYLTMYFISRWDKVLWT